MLTIWTVIYFQSEIFSDPSCGLAPPLVVLKWCGQEEYDANDGHLGNWADFPVYSRAINSNSDIFSSPPPTDIYGEKPGNVWSKTVTGC